MIGFFVRVQKPGFSPFFGTFFKFFGKPDIFSKNFLTRFTWNKKLQHHAKNQNKWMNGSSDMKADGQTNGLFFASRAPLKWRTDNVLTDSLNFSELLN